jgi:hypothetical protein
VLFISLLLFTFVDMKANELRIGNWVFAPQYRNVGKHITEVKTISKEYADHNGKWQQSMVINYTLPETGARDIILIDSDCDPIPLTEEILLKCGFEKFEVEGYPIFIIGKFYLEFYSLESVFLISDIEVKIKHLHQLQNLYFCLTGEELTIEL